MDQATQDFVLKIINEAKDLTLATVRDDGYPQATTVSYGSDGLTLYVGVGKDSQKANNIRHNNKVSLTLNTDYDNWNQIQGLSMGGTAEIVEDMDGIRHAEDCMMRRFPELADWAKSTPGWADVIFLKIQPQVISILDYEKGFGHTELVTV